MSCIFRFLHCLMTVFRMLFSAGLLMFVRLCLPHPFHSPGPPAHFDFHRGYARCCQVCPNPYPPPFFFLIATFLFFFHWSWFPRRLSQWIPNVFLFHLIFLFRSSKEFLVASPPQQLPATPFCACFFIQRLFFNQGSTHCLSSCHQGDRT